MICLPFRDALVCLVTFSETKTSSMSYTDFMCFGGVSIVPEINFRGVVGQSERSKSVQYDTKLTFCPILGQVCL